MDSKPDNIDIDRRSNMKDAASFLLKGGSLLSTPCESCNGVQIKYKGEVICINCGKQQLLQEKSTNATSGSHFNGSINEPQNHTTAFHSLESEIQERIVELFKNLKSEFNDPSIERQRIELIEMYLGLLERLKKYSRGWKDRKNKL
jgi:uncharacterized Zn finger protein (UPF0148 family)